MTPLRIVQVGEELGLILPDEVLERLELCAGDPLVLTVTANHLTLTRPAGQAAPWSDESPAGSAKPS